MKIISKCKRANNERLKNVFIKEEKSMKKKLKTIGVFVLSLCIICGFSMTAQAASGGVTMTAEKQILYATLNYPEPGHSLSITVAFSEKHTQTNHVHSDSCSNGVAGNYTSVSVSRNPSIGYEYTSAYATGYVDGTVVGTFNKDPIR